MKTELTDPEQNGLLVAFLGAEDDCAHNLAPLFAEVRAIVTARMAEAWDEGFRAGGHHELSTDDRYATNPYRAAEHEEH